MKVALVDADAERAEVAAAGIVEAGGNACRACRCDATSREQVEATVDAIVGEWGGIHVLVNNVGASFADWLEDISGEDTARCFSVNCASHLLMTQAVVPVMKRQEWGRILFISSSSGLKGSAGLALYSASKYFVRGLGVATGLELARSGVTANVICPSDIVPDDDTPAGAWRVPRLVEISCAKEGVETFEELVAARKRKNPTGRACTPEDVAALVCFLAGEQAGFINAQTIGVNGGSLPT
jgi:3-oxoacyl-[acyl-carrier protein] reductase